MSASDEQLSGPDRYFGPLRRANYIRLVTFRRSGVPVPTPVHVVTDGPVAYFRTWDVSGKAQRLRHTASVEGAPSTVRGRVRGPVLQAEAHLLSGAESERAARLIAGRHPFLHGRLIPWFHRKRGWVTQQYRLDPPSAAG